MGQPRQKADSSPLKRIRNDKYLKPGSRRGAPRNDKYVSERGGETLGVSLRFPFGKIREAVSASLAAGMHRSFVGSPSRGEGLRFLRMTTERGRVLGRWGHLRLRGFSKSPPFRKKREKDGAARQKADSSPLKRIRNDKYMKAGSSRGAPRNDKCVKADSLRLREKSPHPGG